MKNASTHDTFTLDNTYAQPVERVFAAWSDPKKKRAWFAEGEGWTVLAFDADFREGGTERTRFRGPDGAEMGNDTYYHDIVPGQRIVMSYAMTMGAARISVSLATIEVEAAGTGTRLRFTEQATFFDGGDGIDVRRLGWTELLAALGRALEGGVA